MKTEDTPEIIEIIDDDIDAFGERSASTTMSTRVGRDGSDLLLRLALIAIIGYGVASSASTSSVPRVAPAPSTTIGAPTTTHPAPTHDRGSQAAGALLRGSATSTTDDRVRRDDDAERRLLRPRLVPAVGHRRGDGVVGVMVLGADVSRDGVQCVRHRRLSGPDRSDVDGDLTPEPAVRRLRNSLSTTPLPCRCSRSASPTMR